MKSLIDSFWRAAAYCLHPRVVLWSLVPLLIATVGFSLLFGGVVLARMRAILANAQAEARLQQLQRSR